MENLLTKQGPQGAYNTDLHELEKDCHLTTFSKKNTFYEISVYQIKCLRRPGIYYSKIFFPIRP